MRFGQRRWAKTTQIGPGSVVPASRVAPQLLSGYAEGNAATAYPLADSAMLGHRIAIVKPIFTATAYSSFYSFYSANQNAPADAHITRQASLRLLNAHIVDTWAGPRDSTISWTRS